MENKTSVTKTCSTCAHRKWDSCMRSGYYTTVTRQGGIKCSVDFDGWVKRKNVLKRIKFFFLG